MVITHYIPKNTKTLQGTGNFLLLRHLGPNPGQPFLKMALEGLTVIDHLGWFSFVVNGAAQIPVPAHRSTMHCGRIPKPTGSDLLHSKTTSLSIWIHMERKAIRDANGLRILLDLPGPNRTGWSADRCRPVGRNGERTTPSMPFRCCAPPGATSGCSRSARRGAPELGTPNGPRNRSGCHTRKGRWF